MLSAPTTNKVPSYFDTNDVLCWNALRTRTYTSTMFFDEITLRRLDLFELVLELMANGGLHDFIGKRDPTYLCLVKEFLTTLEVISPKDVHFRLQGRACNSSYAAMGVAFCVTRKCSKKWNNAMRVLDTAEIWRKLTGMPENFKDFRLDDMVTNLALRLCLRVLGSTFYESESTTIVDPGVIDLLYCLIPKSTIVLDRVLLFLNMCDRVRGQRNENYPLVIPFGGMITLLAIFHGVDVSSLQHVRHSYTWDIDTLVSARMLEKLQLPYAIERFRWLSGPLQSHHQYLPTIIHVGLKLVDFRRSHVPVDTQLRKTDDLVALVNDVEDMQFEVTPLTVQDASRTTYPEKKFAEFEKR